MRTCVDTLRRHRRRGEQRRHRARPHADEHDAGGVRRRDRRQPAGHLVGEPPRGAGHEGAGRACSCRSCRTRRSSARSGRRNYAASKAGVMGMLYAWDVELQRYGIRTNALWPIAQTDMTQVVFANAAKRAEADGTPGAHAGRAGLRHARDGRARSSSTSAATGPRTCAASSSRSTARSSGCGQHPHEQVLGRRAGVDGRRAGRRARRCRRAGPRRRVLEASGGSGSVPSRSPRRLAPRNGGSSD